MGYTSACFSYNPNTTARNDSGRGPDRWTASVKDTRVPLEPELLTQPFGLDLAGVSIAHSLAPWRHCAGPIIDTVPAVEHTVRLQKLHYSVLESHPSVLLSVCKNILSVGSAKCTQLGPEAQGHRERSLGSNCAAGMTV